MKQYLCIDVSSELNVPNVRFVFRFLRRNEWLRSC